MLFAQRLYKSIRLLDYLLKRMKNLVRLTLIRFFSRFMVVNIDTN